MYALFVLQPLALTVQYSLLSLGWRRSRDVGRPLELRGGPERARSCVETILNAFRLVVFFSFIPVGARAA